MTVDLSYDFMNRRTPPRPLYLIFASIGYQAHQSHTLVVQFPSMVLWGFIFYNLARG